MGEFTAPNTPGLLSKRGREMNVAGQLCCTCLILNDGHEGAHYGDYHYYYGQSLPVLSTPPMPKPGRHFPHPSSQPHTQTLQKGLPSPRPSHSRHRSLWQPARCRKTRAQGSRMCPEKVLSPAPPLAPAPAETAILRAAGWQVSSRDGAVLTRARCTLTDALALSASPLLTLATFHSPASCPVSASFTTHKALSNPLPPIYLNLSFLSCLLVLLKPACSP